MHGSFATEPSNSFAKKQPLLQKSHKTAQNFSSLSPAAIRWVNGNRALHIHRLLRALGDQKKEPCMFIGSMKKEPCIFIDAALSPTQGIELINMQGSFANDPFNSVANSVANGQSKSFTFTQSRYSCRALLQKRHTQL